jgi:GT2 family glycosyltransferase
MKKLSHTAFGSTSATLGAVVIGRNEGENLARCLRSLIGHSRVIYVDSRSTDSSVAVAQGLGVTVVELDMSVPFTAARARNAGFARLLEVAPDVELVQMVDGDCEVVDGWLDAARAALAADPALAVVCGRRRERHPEASIYNRLADIEWDTPVGDALACGGDAMMRVDALREVGGYDDTLIAGEEPELCVRLRAAGGQVWRLPVEMTLHDAAMLRFGQWWKRAMRGGHAYAEGASLHGAPPERHFVAETRRALVWGVGLPLASLGLALLVHPVGLVLLLAFPLQLLRLAWRERAGGAAGRERALFLLLARFPEAQGVMTYWLNRLRRRRAGLIEYK